MKAIAYAIAGSASLMAAAFAPGMFSIVASAWSGLLFVLLISYKEPNNDR